MNALFVEGLEHLLLFRDLAHDVKQGEGSEERINCKSLEHVLLFRDLAHDVKLCEGSDERMIC